MGQSIQEWTKRNLWRTTFKKFHLVHSCILCPISGSRLILTKANLLCSVLIHATFTNENEASNDVTSLQNRYTIGT